MGGTMSDWTHELPVPSMVVLVFGFTYLLALAIHAGVQALATADALNVQGRFSAARYAG
jgi:hypothetical protein